MKFLFVTRARFEQAEEERCRLAGQYVSLEEEHTNTVIVNACLTDTLASTRKALKEAQARYEAEKKRADQLQARLDEAVRMPGHNPLYAPTIQTAENGVDA
ncbi:hypothetical protein ACWEG1_05730 [Streptomyces bauhiniae]